MNSAVNNDGTRNILTSHIVFISSKDEPSGIADDFFLLRELSRRGISYQYLLWTDILDDQYNHINHHTIVIRSLWEGRTRTGCSESLLRFFAWCADHCPKMRHDYRLLDWTTHKSYLIRLENMGVKVVPSCIVPSSDIGKRRSGHFISHTIESSPGSIKREMSMRGWSHAILKPAVGTRCENVIMLSLEMWSLSIAFTVARLLKEGDCLLQPFLPPICHFTNGAHCDNTLGEICILCIDGKIAHAVHKNPSLWGWHHSTCGCAGIPESLESAICSCLDKVALVRKSSSNPLHISLEATVEEKSLPKDVASMLERASVELVHFPLPECCTQTVEKVLDILRMNSDGICPFLCRMDFLPRCVPNAENWDNIEWLLSEVEGQWCEGFFRAAPQSVFETLFCALEKRF